MTMDNPGGMQVVIHNHPESPGWIRRWFLRTFLMLSIVANIVLFTAASSYLAPGQVSERFRAGDATATDKIAVVPVSGMITSDGVKSAIKELKRAAEDASVKAVLLEIDTPGGTLSGSDELYHAVVEFKASSGGKPVVAFMKGMATSGGYYVAVASDRIVAERSTVTGSIGVIMSLFHAERLLDKIGVTPEIVKSGPMKDSGSMFRPMSEAERREWQKLVDGMYRQFLDVVLKHRGQAIGGEEKLRPLADGRVFLAGDALDAKLIDALGYEQDALDAAKKLAGLSDKVRIVDYSRPLPGLASLFFGQTSPPPAADWRRVVELMSPQLLLMPGPNAATVLGRVEGKL
jgi:protease-4